MLKEGVDYRVKVSFKVRWVWGVLCPTTGSPPQGVLGYPWLLPLRVPLATHGSLPWDICFHPLPLGSVPLWGSVPTLSSPTSATLGVLAVPTVPATPGSLLLPEIPSMLPIPGFPRAPCPS